ncbi:phage major capsid protein [uncultured Megasphaera sp.]|uniref:phage major capsid protein n=1 Tax=uncultured Megasphaera sp. TaxID=165188 RepID=UPI0025FAC6AC|nr:phage major capsid protein [uncultured Megasphaera sp.]
MDKRLNEIMQRKAEIRTALQGEEKVDLKALEKELKDLNQEEEELRRRQAVADMLNEQGAAADDADARKIEKPGTATADDNIYDSMEYRMAFMRHVTRNVPMPKQFELRSNSNTLTTDVGAVVPPQTLNRIVEKIEAYGMILPLVTRTNYITGMAIPTSDVKPVATWVNEGATSDLQKKTTGTITFSHYKLRCAASVSLETDYMALSAFEDALVRNISEAMAKAIEQAILTGDGTTQPTGILKTLPTGDANIATSKLDYKTLVSAEAALPMEYENGAVWVMSKKTFMAFVGMTDSAGQPIARVNYGIGGTPERSLLGRRVILTTYLPSFTTTLKKTDVFAFIFRFSDYVLNTNFSIGMKMYEDNETDDIIRKSIMVCDGKVIDDSSLVVMTGATA